MALLLLADHDGADLTDASLRALSAALALDPCIDILLAGQKPEDAAQQAAHIPGVRQVLLASGDCLAKQLAEPMQALIYPLMTEYAFFLAPATSIGKALAPRLAAALDVMQISDITAVIDAQTFTRFIYAGNAVQTLVSREPKKIITVCVSHFPPAPRSGGHANITRLAAPEGPFRTTFVSETRTKNGRPELTSAKCVVAGGRAFGSRENFEALVGVLAEKLGAAIGASRAAVDLGYAPNDYQIGQTGKIVAPDLYIALGISGAIQHLAGMKSAGVIVAINADATAPIFAVADYGLVADVFSAVPELIAAIESLS